MLRRVAIGLVVLIVSVGLVAALSAVTNEMAPQWDMVSYLDMAQNGLAGNHNLVAPFAYRPAAPLAIGAISRLTGWSVADTFRICARLTAVMLIAGCFLLARRLGTGAGGALWIAVVLPLNMWYIRFPLFAVSMVDIYAYPILLLAFYLLWEDRLWLCLAVAAPGLFFKEFLLIPLLTVAGVWTYRGWKDWRRLVAPLAAIGAILFACFLLPRALIHVVQSFQDIDPKHPETLVRLIRYPLSWRRWLNILFGYIAIWLPALMLLTRSRLLSLRARLAPRAPMLLIFLVAHLLLVVYGGTNILVFVSYSLPVEILVLRYLLDDAKPHVLELVLATAAVIAFNRTWARIPTPEEGIEQYLLYYGGYFNMIRPRTFFRLAEALAYIGSAQLLRLLLQRGAVTTGSRPDSQQALRGQSA